MNHGNRRATVVIGAGFGDEGKGLMTDYHCRSAGNAGETIVVRFNGGAQAGHTVQLPDGTRHVFHHIGSGTLAGAGTFLSRFFIVNPFLWRKEMEELRRAIPPVTVDAAAPLTTPFDMLVNQEIESARGGARHGSCGLGINETIERNSVPELATHVRDIGDPVALRAAMYRIREWAGERLAAIVTPGDMAEKILASDTLIDNYIDAAVSFARETTIADGSHLATAGGIVFEGAQGLLLDEDHEFFPHVTRSKTGLHNVIAIAREIGIAALDVTYITRAYATRHGAGPFPTEDPSLSFPDPTNVPNQYQGTLRFGRLDLDLLSRGIENDLAGVSGIEVNPCLAITCMDQFPDGEIPVRCDGRDLLVASRGLLTLAPARVGIPLRYISYGPTHEDVRST